MWERKKLNTNQNTKNPLKLTSSVVNFCNENEIQQQEIRQEIQAIFNTLKEREKQNIEEFQLFKKGVYPYITKTTGLSIAKALREDSPHHIFIEKYLKDLEEHYANTDRNSLSEETVLYEPEDKNEFSNH